MLGTTWSLSVCLSANILNLHALPHRGQPGCLLPHCPNSIFTQQSSEDSRDLLFLCAILPVSFPYGLGVEQVYLNPGINGTALAGLGDLWFGPNGFSVSPPERLENAHGFPLTLLYCYSFNYYLAESSLRQERWHIMAISVLRELPNSWREGSMPSIHQSILIFNTHIMCTYTFT